MAHRNIPIFIPHLGCPNACVFCNQHSITAVGSFDIQTVRPQIEEAMQTLRQGDTCEIAFFGGSFTGIDRDLMVQLLEIATDCIQRSCGLVQSIRLSTRPDYINEEILSILKRYPVMDVELGLQSMDDEVLKKSNRGHTAQQARQACREVVCAGFHLVGQMMIGLPGSDLEKELATAQEICDLGACACRIYPTVVFKKTELCRMAERGEYTLLSDEEAVSRSAKVLKVFEDRGVKCIRIGLCASENLSSDEEVLGGANHPALGEMVRSELLFDQICSAVSELNITGNSLDVYVPLGKTSQAIGQHKRNIERLRQYCGISDIRIKEWDGPVRCCIAKED